MASTKLNYLNLGCGTKIHKDWLNIDIVPRSEEVVQCNFLKSIPYPDNTFDIVYHSQVLEHFSKEDGERLIKECFRVLKPGGMIRVVVPDLEDLARKYIELLDLNLVSPNADSDSAYTWTLLQLFDQATRNEEGGDMMKYVKQSKIINEAFVVERGGEVIKKMIQYYRENPDPNYPPQKKQSTLRKLLSLLIPRNYNEKLKNLILTEDERKYLKIGEFRLSGEIHYWMYDRYSLTTLMKNIGFKNPKIQTPLASDIPNWQSYYLDVKENGDIYDRDVLYFEAQKPN